MKYIKYFVFGALLATCLMAYPIYSFHQSELLENVTIPEIDTGNEFIKEYSFYEGEHYRLTKQEILYYMQNTKFNQGAPIKPIELDEDDTLGAELSNSFETIPEEISAVLKGMRTPVDEEYFQISSNFGLRDDPITQEENVPHWGIDIAAPGIQGAPVYAVMDGVVEFASERNSFGNLVVLSHHSGKIKTYYAHMDTIEDIIPGDQVKKGQQIGTVGNTGRSTGAHLHFEVHVPINPTLFIGRS